MRAADGKTGRVVVITGPSGVGKSTIVREVLQRTGAKFSVSATTRAPRSGEIDAREYHFITRETFEQMVASGEMLEWAEVFGELYGTPAYPVREASQAGHDILLDIDVQGGIQVHAKLPDATYILIEPPSDEVLGARLRGRGTESEDKVARRLSKAMAEVQAARDSGVYTHSVINDDLETAVRQVINIIDQES